MPKEIAPVLWLSFGRPDVNTYIPFYPVATQIPDFYHFVPGNGGWEVSLKNHFTPLPGTYEYQPDRAYWIFNDLENISGLAYYKTIDTIQQTWKKQEKEAFALQTSIESSVLSLYKTNPKLALRFLQGYSNSRAAKALQTAKVLTTKLKSRVYR
jgi:dipeptidase